MSTRPGFSSDPIVQRLQALAVSSPELHDIAHLYQTILPILRDSELHVRPISLTRDEVREKMDRGLPLLHEINLNIDSYALRNLILQLARAIEKRDDPGANNNQRLQTEAVRRIRLAIENDTFDISALLPHIIAKRYNLVSRAIQDLQFDPHLTLTLVQYALRPALRAWCRQLTSLVGGVPWRKGICFICGATAMLAELQGNNQVKHLRCGQCGADWEFRRLQCVYCGNNDHNTQRYLYVDGLRTNMQVEVCDKCHGYLKLIAAFAPTPPDMLHIADIATLLLDYFAQERGYTRHESAAHV